MSLVPIKYVGAKARRTDSVAGTGLAWEADTVHMVPPEVAVKLLRHPDVWAKGEEPEGAEAAKLADKPELETEESLALKVGLPNLAAMSKADLGQMAAARFGITLPQTMKVADMRAKIVALENSGRQRGD
jgi:hypothetical protein